MAIPRHSETRLSSYERIQERLLAIMQEGTLPWAKPWSVTAGRPRNLISKKFYRGSNVLFLGVQQYASPWWLTFNQAKQLGGNIRKGEKGTPITFWKSIPKKERDTTTGEERSYSVPFLQTYVVFNVAQCEGIKVPSTPTADVVIEDRGRFVLCEEVGLKMEAPVTVKYGYAGAWYRPAPDIIEMPTLAEFQSPEEFYSTKFHEMIHATGHAKRLDRTTLTDAVRFGDVKYCQEELVAEIGASFLCAHVGIDNVTLNNSAAYLRGWMERLQGDVRMFLKASSEAQKAVDYILNLPPDVQGGKDEDEA